MASDEPVILASGLVKWYGSVLAVSDFTLKVERGSIFGLLGPNGAGKTTAVKMLLGLIRPSAGNGRLLGRPLGDRWARAMAGYLPELFRYPDWLEGCEVLELHARLAKIDRGKRARSIARVLDVAGLSARAASRVATYSKGMQQRLGLAVALLGDPDVVFLDEPTSALDPVGRHDVRGILRGLRDAGKTVFLNSHLLTEVEQVCDRVAIVRAGRVVAEGTLDHIVGAAVGVRVRAEAGGRSLNALLRPFGNAVEEEGGAFLRDVDRARVPEIVSTLVSAGARVYAIEPVAQTLEERFLEMMDQA